MSWVMMNGFKVYLLSQPSLHVYTYGLACRNVTTVLYAFVLKFLATLQTIVPSTLQLSAIAAQMLVISPVLSTISALVVPLVALVIALLGSRLQTSKDIKEGTSEYCCSFHLPE
ncbi:hypothetical protein BVRB_9g208690 [Beta vulgaris subsp. vulgaris]|nr:hypothetical protein BVRB_9g208690 [Beta vulgaris subsp. vulgaris]